MNLKKIKRAKMFTFSLPDDVAAELDKQERGKKSQIVAEALREYFAQKGIIQPSPEKREVVSGMTEEEILKRMKDYLQSEFSRKEQELKAEIEEARKQKDYAHSTSLREIWLNKLWGSRTFFEEITIAEIQAALGLPYMTIYNKILPVLRRAGYKIVTNKFI